MNIRTTLQASVSRFAHLAGFGKVKAKSTKAEDDEDKKKKDDDASAEDDSDDEKMEDDDRDESAKGNDDEAGEDDGDDSDDDKKKKNKKGKKAASDDDDERCEDDEGDKKEARHARRMERERIARILGSSAAARNIELAVSLACETGISSKAAIATLNRTRAVSTSNAREGRNPRIETTAGDAAPKGAQIAKSWDQAFVKVGITPRAA